MNTYQSRAKTAQIVCTIRSLVTELQSRGLDYSAIENGIHAFPKSSRLVIEGNGRISFPDYKAKVYLNPVALFSDSEFREGKIESLCAESKTVFYATVSRIKRKFCDAVGNLNAESFIIKKERGGKYRISSNIILMKGI